MHRPVNHAILYVKLEPVVRWVDVASRSIIIPCGEELAGTEATEAVVDFGEGGEGETSRELFGTETRIAADVYLGKGMVLCGSGTVVWAGGGAWRFVGVEGADVVGDGRGFNQN